jgi:hypothetical protein
MDETGARVKCPRGEKIIISSDIKEAYTQSLKNRKSVTIIEIVYADRREPSPLFIITLRSKIIEN